MGTVAIPRVASTGKPIRAADPVQPTESASIRNSRSGNQHRAGFTLAIVVILSACGCTDRRTLIDAFPTGSAAAPWLLDSPVWSGDFESAAGAIGDDATTWRRFAPQHVWLAVYKHDSRPAQRVTIRVFDLGSTDQARRAYSEFKPPLAPNFGGGDEACWTSDGLLLVWGRLVLDIFGGDAQRAAVPEQAVYLLAFLEKNMPPGLPENPR